jgi:hypothetical protein
MKNLSVLILILTAILRTETFAQTIYSALDGMTPVGLEPGSPTGSYALSGLDTINLYNGSSNVTIPLLQIGGRGEAGYTMVARYAVQWEGTGFIPDEPSQDCSQGGPCWAIAPTEPFNYRPASIGIRHLVRFVQPVLINGSSSPSCWVNGTTLARIAITFADGTEMTLIDTVVGGVPVSPSLTSLSSCNPQGFDRGTVFVSTDGSGAAFVAENHIHDVNTPGAASVSGETPAGTLYLRDGRQYHFGNHATDPTSPFLLRTVVDQIRDRNGNVTTFNYGLHPDGFQSGFTVTDPLGRIITVAEGKEFMFPDASCIGGLCNGVYDQITYGAAGQEKTITSIVVISGTIASLLSRTAQGRHCRISLAGIRRHQWEFSIGRSGKSFCRITIPISSITHNMRK